MQYIVNLNLLPDNQENTELNFQTIMCIVCFLKKNFHLDM